MSTLTKEEIFQLFGEADRRIQEHDRNVRDIWKLLAENAQQLKETDRIVKETAAQMKETDRKVNETAAQLKETDRIVKETSAQMKETDRIVKETSAQMKETDRKVKEMTQSIGRLGNRLGEFVEEMVRPSAVRLFRERGIDVHQVARNFEASRNGEAVEIDLLVVNDTEAVLIEVKSELKIDDVKEHVERLGRFKRVSPQYAGCRIMGAVAAMVTPDEAARYAYRQGLFVLGQTGEAMTIRNDAKFQPKLW